MGGRSCIIITTDHGKVFRVAMDCNGGVNIRSPLGLGDHVLEFLRDEGKRKELKRLASRFELYEVAESENDEWVEDNLERDGSNVLEHLLRMLRNKEELKEKSIGPNPYVWLDIDEYSYEIDFYRDQLWIDYFQTGYHIFGLNSLPSSQDIQMAIAPSRLVGLDWGEIQKARSSFHMARRSLNKVSQEIEKSKSFYDNALESLDNFYEAVKTLGIFSM